NEPLRNFPLADLRRRIFVLRRRPSSAVSRESLRGDSVDSSRIRWSGARQASPLGEKFCTSCSICLTACCDRSCERTSLALACACARSLKNRTARNVIFYRLFEDADESFALHWLVASRRGA